MCRQRFCYSCGCKTYLILVAQLTMPTAANLSVPVSLIVAALCSA